MKFMKILLIGAIAALIIAIVECFLMGLTWGDVFDVVTLSSWVSPFTAGIATVLCYQKLKRPKGEKRGLHEK